MAVLRLSLERELHWAVFEPNGEALWGEVRRMVHAFLTRLYEAGAFRRRHHQGGVLRPLRPSRP